jgi:tetratricopeptide (TPR) repeat protein
VTRSTSPVATRDKTKPSPPLRSPTLASNRSVQAGAVVLAVVTVVAYVPSLHGGFILDDDILLTANRLVKAPDGLYRMWLTTDPIDYWPVFNSVFWLQWRLWGMWSTGYHVTNLLLHIGAAFLMWAILRRLSIPGAFLAALLFAVHPVNVESVAWIAQCKSVLALVFYLLSILLYLWAESGAPRCRGGRWYWWSLVAFVLGMLSKGSVAILPLVLLGVIGWLRPLSRGDLVRTAPFFLVAVVLVLVNVWFQKHGTPTQFRAAGATERLLGAAAAVWFYLSKALLPIDLTFIYPRWHIQVTEVTWWLPLLAAMAVTAVLWWCRSSWGRPLLFAWGYFGVALVPVLGFTDVAFMEHSLVADHYQHVALIGVLAPVAAGWATWQRRAGGRLPLAAAVAAVGVLALLTWRQSGLYTDAMTLYQATLRENPDSWLAHGNLGGVLSEAGRLPEAIAHYQQALRLHPDFPDAHNNLCSALRDSGQLAQAIQHCREALRLRPNFPESHNNLGNALRDSGQLAEAIEEYRQALQLRPDYPAAHNNLGTALAQAGRLQEGIAHLQQAVRLQPDYADAQYNLRVALALQQQAAERQQ